MNIKSGIRIGTTIAGIILRFSMTPAQAGVVGSMTLGIYQAVVFPMVQRVQQLATTLTEARRNMPKDHLHSTIPFPESAIQKATLTRLPFR